MIIFLIVAMLILIFLGAVVGIVASFVSVARTEQKAKAEAAKTAQARKVGLV